MRVPDSRTRVRERPPAGVACSVLVIARACLPQRRHERQASSSMRWWTGLASLVHESYRSPRCSSKCCASRSFSSTCCASSTPWMRSGSMPTSSIGHSPPPPRLTFGTSFDQWAVDRPCLKPPSLLRMVGPMRPWRWGPRVTITPMAMAPSWCSAWKLTRSRSKNGSSLSHSISTAIPGTGASRCPLPNMSISWPRVRERNISVPSRLMDFPMVTFCLPHTLVPPRAIVSANESSKRLTKTVRPPPPARSSASVGLNVARAATRSVKRSGEDCWRMTSAYRVAPWT